MVWIVHSTTYTMEILKDFWRRPRKCYRDTKWSVFFIALVEDEY